MLKDRWKFSNKWKLVVSVPVRLSLHPEKSNARVSRVVGDALAYVTLPSGKNIALAGNDIVGYTGQRFSDLGLKAGALIEVEEKPDADSLVFKLSKIS